MSVSAPGQDQAAVNEVVMGLMKDTEKRNAELMSKNIALEQELNGYKQYMRDLVGKHMKEVKLFKKKIANLEGIESNSRPTTANSISSAGTEYRLIV